MKLPQRDTGPWARELITECETSRKARFTLGACWREYFMRGAATGPGVPYNKCAEHAKTLSAHLFSPGDIRFAVTTNKSDAPQDRENCNVAGSILSRDFRRRCGGLQYSQAVLWALIKGKTLIKEIWGHSGVDYHLVQPEMMGVLREDLDSLDQQEAFFHSTYLTPTAVKRLLTGNPRGEAIMNQVRDHAKQENTDPTNRDDYFKELIVGGLNPVSLTPIQNPPTIGVTHWQDGPSPQLPATVKTGLIRLDELWVLDDDREDWSTIQILGDDVVLEGGIQRSNLTGIKGEQPFREVCPNPVPGYFWGRSEFADLYLCQDAITERMAGIQRMLRLQENPNHFYKGFAGNIDERMATMDKPGGWITEDSPNADIKSLAPELPNDVFETLTSLIQFFDDMAGMKNVSQGRGESGVRSQGHAETLVRMATPRLRNRALIVEHQLEEVGDLHLQLLQRHDATPYRSRVKPDKHGPELLRLVDAPPQADAEFILDQLPDDCAVEVDSHSASPAFADESLQKAIELFKAGAIGPVDLIRLTHPAHEDSLIAAAEERAETEAQMMREHPELLAQKGGKKR